MQTSRHALKLSKFEGSTCDLCQGPIAVGDGIWPLEASSNPGVQLDLQRKRGRFIWAHAEPCARSALGGSLIPPPCSHWQRHGFCDFGDRCFYGHPERTSEAAAPATVAHAATSKSPAPTQEEAAAVVVPGSGWASTKTNRNNPKNKRKKTRNASKCTVLRRWLCDTFGAATLKSGEGVVDVAGGSGELAFELLNLTGVREALVVEPQPALRLARFAAAHAMRNAYGRNPLYAHHGADPAVAAASRAAGGWAPDHLRVFFDAAMVTWLLAQRPDDDDGDDDQRQQQQQRQQREAGHRIENLSRAAPSTVGPAAAVVEEEEERHQLRRQQQQEWLDGRLRAAEAAAGTWAGFGHERGGGGGSGGGVGESTSQDPSSKPPLQAGSTEVVEEAEPGPREPTSVKRDRSHGATGEDGQVQESEQQQQEKGQQQQQQQERQQKRHERHGRHEAVGADGGGRLVVRADEAVARLLGCALLVGLHPDQATEPLVDLALALRKPFAVVPCCVHAKAAPRRRLLPAHAAPPEEAPLEEEAFPEEEGPRLRTDQQHQGKKGRAGGREEEEEEEGGERGLPVRTYEAFVAYLQAKSRHIRTAQLPFGGRSTVLYVADYGQIDGGDSSSRGKEEESGGDL